MSTSTTDQNGSTKFTHRALIALAVVAPVLTWAHILHLRLRLRPPVLRGLDTDRDGELCWEEVEAASEQLLSLWTKTETGT